MPDEPQEPEAAPSGHWLLALKEIITRLQGRRGSTFGKRPHSLYHPDNTDAFERSARALESVRDIVESLRGFGRNASGPTILAELTPAEQERLARIVDRLDRYGKVVANDDLCRKEFQPRVEAWVDHNAPWLVSRAVFLFAHVRELLRSYDYVEDPLVWLLPKLTSWAVAISRETSPHSDLDALRAAFAIEADRLGQELAPFGLDVDASRAVDNTLLHLLQTGHGTIAVPQAYANLGMWATVVMRRDIVLHAVSGWDYVDQTRPDAAEVEQRRIRFVLSAFKDISHD